ncbi:MAG TPA: YggT family protein [Bacilli bacterium]|nr:YggT family protein [Bacilli bacterium]
MILQYIISTLYYLLLGYGFIMMLGVLLSWLPGLHQYKIAQLIRKMTNWYLWPFRGFLVIGMLDFTPAIGLILYQTIIGFLAAFI